MTRHAPSAAPKKSTNVRLRAVRGVFRSLSLVSPEAAARLAMVLFRRPPRHSGSELDRSVLQSAERVDLILDGRRLAVWRWGQGPRAPSSLR